MSIKKNLWRILKVAILALWLCMVPTCKDWKSVEECFAVVIYALIVALLLCLYHKGKNVVKVLIVDKFYLICAIMLGSVLLSIMQKNAEPVLCVETFLTVFMLTVIMWKTIANKKAKE